MKTVTILTVMISLLTTTLGEAWARRNPPRRPVVVNKRTHVTVITRGHSHRDHGDAIAAGIVGLTVGAIVGSAAANASRPPAQTVVVQQPVVVAPPAVGTVAYALPGGCSTANVNGVQYYNCAGIYYQPYFGNNGVYYQIIPKPF